MECNVFYVETNFLMISKLLMTLNIQCSCRSFTAVLSPDKCGFNVAYFPIVDIVVMVTLTAGERVVVADFTH